MRLVIILLYCYIVIFTFGQLARFTFEIPEITIHLADILVGLLMLTWLGWKLIRREKFLLPSLTNQILLFFLFAAVSLALNSSFVAASIRRGDLLSGREMIVAWLYLLRWIFYAGLYFLVVDLCHEMKNFGDRAEKLLIGVGLAVAISGIMQYFLLPDTRFLESFGWDPHYYRLIGTFLDPGFTGIILVLCLILLTVKILSSNRKILLPLWVIAYIALALTYSRASYLAYLAGMGIIAYAKKLPKFFLAILLLGIATILVLPRPGGEGVRLERKSTIEFRLINWSQSLEIAKDHFWWGVGFNAYRYSQRDYNFLEFANWRASHAGGGADSSLLFVLATTGIFGLLSFLWLWGKVVSSSYQSLDFLILAGTAALFIHSFFVNSLFYPWVMAWFWVLLGVRETRVGS